MTQMKRPSFLWYLLLFIFIGCNNSKIIQYKFKGVIITRVDYEGKTNFFYGSCGSINSCSTTDLVIAEYYGFNNGMDVFMVFKNDSTVELIHYGGEFLKKIGQCRIDTPQYSNDKLSGTLDKYKNLGFGIMRLSNLLELEKKFPENSNSKVSVQYNLKN